MLEGQQQEANFRLQVSIALSFSYTGQVSTGLRCRLSLSVGWAVGTATQVLAAAFYQSSRKFLMVLLGKPSQGFSRIFVQFLQKITGANVS